MKPKWLSRNGFPVAIFKDFQGTIKLKHPLGWRFQQKFLISKWYVWPRKLQSKELCGSNEFYQESPSKLVFGQSWNDNSFWSIMKQYCFVSTSLAQLVMDIKVLSQGDKSHKFKPWLLHRDASHLRSPKAKDKIVYFPVTHPTHRDSA